MTYWKVRFDSGAEGFGWLVLDADLIAVKLTDIDGNAIIDGVSYTPIEFDSKPEWADVAE